MPHPALRIPTATPLPILCTRMVSRCSLVAAFTFFFCVSILTLLAFSPQVTADELAPTAPGSIAGMVKNSNGEPVANVQVFLYRKTPYSSDYWNLLRSVTTPTDGKYRFTYLPAGNYRIGASDPSGKYAAIFYPTAAMIHQGTDINITGNQINDVDLSLYPGGRITGVVTATSSYSLTAGMVTLLQEVIRQGLPYWESVQSASLPIDGGAYTFTNLTANTYRICASSLGSLLATYECYDNVYDINQAMPITLTASATMSNINLVLGDGADFAQVRGRITTSNHEPLANIDVYAIREAEQPFAQSVIATMLPTAAAVARPRSSSEPADSPYDFYGSPYARTDSQGNYHLATLSEGNYRLMFSDPTGNYATTYYNNSSFAENATVIPLVAKQQVTDINMQLPPGGHIRGSATIAGQPAPIQALIPQIKTSLGWQSFEGSSIISTDGHYEIGGLPAGSYRLWAAVSIPDFYTNYFYQGYYSDANAVESDIGYLFTEIPLTVGETKTADIVLLGGPQFEGSLSGRITANGAPLADAKVSLYVSESNCCVPLLPPRQPSVYVFTDDAGHYTINGLAAGYFWVGAADPTGLYATTYYTAQTNLREANLLSVEDGQALTNIDVDLPLAGAISGRVTRPNGQPVPELLISVSMLVNYDNTLVGTQQISNEIRTDGDGRYTVKGVHPGDYTICFSDTERGYTKCYGMLWWVYDLNVGRVKVTAGGTTSDIDLLWGPDHHTYLPIVAQ